jgi:hypothetical protein
VNPTETAFRWRATHQSRVGPICPKCQTPLETHFFWWGELRSAQVMRVKVKNGLSSKPCFEVLVR